MTRPGWIKLTKYEPDVITPSDTSAIYINADHIQSVYEEVEGNGDIVTVIDLVTGQCLVAEELERVLERIETARILKT